MAWLGDWGEIVCSKRKASYVDPGTKIFEQYNWVQANTVEERRKKKRISLRGEDTGCHTEMQREVLVISVASELIEGM